MRQWGRTVGMGHLGQDHTDRTTMTQSGQVNLTGEQWPLGRAARTVLLGGTVGTGQLGQNSWYRTAGRG